MYSKLFYAYDRTSKSVKHMYTCSEQVNFHKTVKLEILHDLDYICDCQNEVLITSEIQQPLKC